MLSGLGCQHSLCLVAMPFTLAIFLVCVLNRDLFIHQILGIHVGDSCVRRFEIGE